MPGGLRGRSAPTGIPGHPNVIQPVIPSKSTQAVVYGNAFSSGFLVMALEMLGSRYLIPYFGAGIYTWAALISTVLIALATGYFIGGHVADRIPSPFLLGTILLLAAGWFALTPMIAPTVLNGMFEAIEDERYGALAGALGLLFIPMALLGGYSPSALRLVLRSSQDSGTVAGRIYGISTLGGIAGTLVPTFFLIPWAGIRAITYGLAVMALLSGLPMFVLGIQSGRLRRSISGRRAGKTGLTLIVALMVGGYSMPSGIALGNPKENALDQESIRNLPNGIVEDRETEHTHIFIRKTGPYLMMTFRLRSSNHIESIINADNPRELSAPYTQNLTAALLYVSSPKKLLMLGLGGGSTTRYMQEYLPGLFIQAVELDVGVIDLAKKYFGIKESPRYRIVNRDARVHLKRNMEKYDIIMADAFRGDRIPFHLLTREFYALVKSRLTAEGVLALNLVQGSKLFASTISTLRMEFRTVEMYPIHGQVVALALQSPPPPAALVERRAERMQKQFGFYHDLRTIARRRRDLSLQGNRIVLTDDYAPVNALQGYGQNPQAQVDRIRMILEDHKASR